ncbi:MAG: translation initiation factor IF-2 [Phascolarctobacterium sp.]|uniref:translation initiation factor IF-2 n=1 Tax=Phascolarctobacterium sp. TaxID=2049039 RepID=UPI0026DD90EE|nr:translation initiation factor IF-2 [Phascolarctobacterium sp.]MDO4921569.1 translation initiation factor IF-2 [Phascolarctobacterium sp.]
MGNKRIYEVAADYGKHVNEVLELLKKHNIDKKNFSGADEQVMAVIRKAYDKKPEAPKAAPKAAKPEPAKQAAPVKKEQPQKNMKANTNGQRTMQQNNQNQRTNNGQGGRGDSRPGNNQQNARQDNRPQQSRGGQQSARQDNRPQQNRGGQQNGRGDRPQQGRSGQQGGRSDNRQGGSRQGGNRQGGIFIGPKGQQPGQSAHGESRSMASARPAGGSSRSESARGDNRQGSRNAGKSRKEKPQIKGSYATKESRPNRSAGHQMPVNRNRKPTNAPKAPAAPVEIVRPTYVEVGESINVQEFAKLIKREVNEVIKALFMLGMMVTINQDIDFDTAQLIGDNFGVEVGQKAPEEDPTEIPEVEDPPEKRLPRPPVITVMGHVDHGKTSLLDAIRKTNVTAREAGGITQHIGAYKVNYQGKQIVFLDTPGHEAFTAMRARGAQVTDVAILVVAADDGVMPQTIEAINHAKAAKVPIIVAINKMDRPGANPDHVKQQLAEQELIPEDWGGDTIMVPVSAHQKTGITDLLEMILLVAEMQELKANPNLPAHGTIIEAQLDKGRGPVATVLVQRGTLHIGDTIIAGTSYGKVRAMINDRGEKVKKALPSTPVEVLGLNDVPQAGDILDSTDEKIARSVAEKRIAKKKEEEIKLNAKVSLDDLFQRIQEGELKELDIVVKADVQGTIEALKASLEKIKNDEVKVVVVHAGVGAITESDVMLASAANALIIGFNVRPDANARKAAEMEKVDVRTYRVIYDALNDVEAAIKGMLAPKFKEVVQGRVEVRQLITISKLLIAGCYVLEGKVTNSSKVRIVRDGIVLHEDVIESLRRFKDDVKEVAQGFECGITLEKYRDIKEGDVFEVYDMEEVAVE